MRHNTKNKNVQDAKLKYLKTFEQFEMINEEEGWKEWMLAGLMTVSSIFGPGKAMANTSGGPGKEMTTITAKAENASNIFKAKILKGSTSEEKCYNDVLVKFGLNTESGSRIYRAKLSDVVKEIGKDSTTILSAFKPASAKDAGLSADDKLIDVFMIDGQKIVNDGFLVFDMSDMNTEIIASGNGLLALTRAIRQASDFKSFDYKTFVKIEFNQPRESKAITIDFSFSKEGFYKQLFFAFETAITPTSQFIGDNTYAHIMGVDKLIGASEEEAVEFIYGTLISGIFDFIPGKLYQNDVKNLPSYLTSNGYELPSKDMIKEYIAKFKAAGKIVDADMTKFNSLVQGLYLKNLRKFANENLGTKASDSLMNEVKEFVNSNAQYSKWETKLAGTRAHAWNAKKTGEKQYRAGVSDTETDGKTYRIGENKKYRK
jgi:hypothetical protein